MDMCNGGEYNREIKLCHLIVVRRAYPSVE